MNFGTPYGRGILVVILTAFASLSLEPTLESQTRRRQAPNRLSKPPGKVAALALDARPMNRLAAVTPPLFEDPLTNGTTIGTRDNGQGEFVPGGWRVVSSSDNIRYTAPFPIEEGAVEFDVTGLRFDDTRPANHQGQLMSMYDASFGDPRHKYSPDLRLNPFKFVLHRFGRDEDAYFANYLKFIMNTDGVNQFEDYSELGAYPWEEGTTYHMRLEWKDGLIRFFLNGRDTDVWPFVYREVYRPGIHDIRIGTNIRNDAILGAVYSNVKIYDFGKVPGSPLVNNPRPVSQSLEPVIDWTGERHTHYHVRVTATSSPDTGIAWDSGEVSGTESSATSGALADGTTYFAHVRLRNDRGWGDWSLPYRFEIRSAEPTRVPRYKEYEIVLRTTTPRSSPYTDVTLSATFSGPSQPITVNGFWDGGEIYKIRMLPTESGLWRFTTRSNDGQLNGRSGSFVCDDGPSKGYVRVSPSHPFGFEWAGDGSPFFLMGDTIWHQYYNVRFSDGSFQRLINDRAEQHFNYAHGVVHDALHNEGGSIYSRQDPTLEMFDVNTLNPAYFQWIDEKIDYMNAKGMVASLFFSWGNGHYEEYRDPSQYERFMRYMVARYASKNVFWIIVGEFEEAGEPLSRWRDYMSVVYNADPYKHPISLHTVETTDAFGNDREHTFIGQQRSGSPEGLRQLISDSRRFGKPVVNLEYGYEGDPAYYPTDQSADDVRRDHYALALAGGYGVYGNHIQGRATYHRTGDFDLTATDTPGAQYMAKLYEFFTGLNFHRLSPAQHLVNRGIAAAWADVEYVVQLPAGGSVNLNLSGARGVFAVDWFDPRTGKRVSAGTTTGGITRAFTAPDGNDWILHVHNYPLNDTGVFVDLGSADVENGLTRVDSGDGRTTPAEIGGRNARRNANPASDLYVYFDVSDGFALEGSRPEAFITIEYFDSGTGTLTLQYDARGSSFETAGSVALGGTNTWKSHTFHLTDAYFGNRQNDGADFRVFGGVNNTFYLDVARIAPKMAGPPAPASNPQPPDRATGVGLQADLSWSAGAGAASHEVLFGTATPPPLRGSQATTSFDPGPLAPSTTYFWRIDEVNATGKTTGPTWSFTTQGKPGPAGDPEPPHGATAVSTSVALAWAPGKDAAAHDVYFGTSSTPGFQARVNQATFDPGPLAPATTYFWRIDEANDAGTTAGPLWSFKTTEAVDVPTLTARPAGSIVIDGNPSDWNLPELTAKVRAGEPVSGDFALVGYDGQTLYVAGYASSLSLPESGSDHTARVYARHDEDRLYFLARLEDDDVRATFGPEANWANDCVEIYIDPENDRGASPLDGSTSDVQLVIDVLNQRNVYMTTGDYRREVLNGVASAVLRDASGWWLEVAVEKRSLAPDLPLDGTLSLDCNFRDNDENNRPDRTTVYTWSDPERSGAFPSKIPDRWGRLVLKPLDRASAPRPENEATEVAVVTSTSWTAGAAAQSQDVYFGTSTPPPFRTNQTATRFDPGPLAADRTYYWKVDTVTAAGKVPGSIWNFRTESSIQQLTLNVKRAGALQIDGNPADWNLASFMKKARGGQVAAGDVALVGFDDDGVLYKAGYATSLPLPESPSDHTARVYARHDATHLYYLVRVEDDDVQAPFGAELNWANDCVEFYIDPAGDGGGSGMSNSTSDIQLVIDAANRKNVYMTTPGYRAQVLAGVTSAVSRDETGFWLEVRIEKRVLDPDLPASAAFGIDFNFRDNDGGNDARRTTVYTWSDGEESGSFPSKIPNRWGRARLLP